MIFVTQDQDVIHDAVAALQKREPLSNPVRIWTLGGFAVARGRVIRVRNLPDGPRGERRTEVETTETEYQD